MTNDEVFNELKKQRILLTYVLGKRLSPRDYTVQWSQDHTKLHLYVNGKLRVIGDPARRVCYPV